jgi:hypothetical protein
MPKQVTFNKVINVQQKLRYNDPASLADGTPGFFGVTSVTDMLGVTADGLTHSPVQRHTTAGAARATEYTPTEIANLVKGSSNSTGNFLLAELTAAYNEAIGGLV